MRFPILRILGIFLGVAALVGLARSGLGFQFREDFLFLLDAVDNLLGGLTWPFEVFIVRPVVRYLHEQGFLFELREHWHNAFVVLWLFNVRFSRTWYPPNFQLVGTAGIPVVLEITFRWMLAAFTALLGATLAGTVPLHHPAVLWWSVAAHFLFRAGDDFMTTWFQQLVSEAVGGALALTLAVAFVFLALGVIDLPTSAGYRPALFWWPTAAYFLYLTGMAIPHWQSPVVAALSVLTFTIAAVTIVLGVGLLPGPELLTFEGSPSPGLASLAAFVVIVAVWILIAAVLLMQFKVDRPLLELWIDRASVGIDILSVLGGAAAIVYLAHLMA